jgi:hypothetical protein
MLYSFYLTLIAIAKYYYYYHYYYYYNFIKILSLFIITIITYLFFNTNLIIIIIFFSYLLSSLLSLLFLKIIIHYLFIFKYQKFVELNTILVEKFLKILKLFCPIIKHHYVEYLYKYF